MKRTQWEGENVKYKDRSVLPACGKQSNSYYHISHDNNLCPIPLTEKKISTIFTTSTMSACTLPTLQMNGKEALKVKDGLPTEITIYHLRLISHHMAVKSRLTAQVEIFIFIIL